MTLQSLDAPVWLLIISAVFCSASAWHYGHEKEWPPKCLMGKHQSPINLQMDKTQERMFNPLIFKQYDTQYKASLTNNGHSVQLKLLNAHTPPSVKGGGLPHEYILDHLHFHWESEHTVHSNRFPLELHMVHYADKFNSTTAALGYDQGLAVIGVLFDLYETEVNEGFTSSLIDGLRLVKDVPNMEVELSTAVAVGKFLPEDSSGFFRYEGSLTTPSCDESVVWTIFTQPGRISEKQLTEFQSVRTHDGPLPENFRGLQDLNGRVVTLRPGLIPLQSSATLHSSHFALLVFVFTLFLVK